MSVSPSAQKVDDFLSKISTISQQRLRENQKTQRKLNSLRGHESSSPLPPADHGISELSFNRSTRRQFYEDWKSKTPPPMPARPGFTRSESGQDKSSLRTRHDDGNVEDKNFEDRRRQDKTPFQGREKSARASCSSTKMVPMKPQKPGHLGAEPAPKLPARPDEKDGPPLPKRPEYSVNLGVPVARKSAPKPVAVKNTPLVPAAFKKVSGSHAIDSFSDIEESIRKGGNRDLFVKTERPKPQKPPKFQSKEAAFLQEQIRSLSPTKRETKAEVSAEKPGLKSVPGEVRPDPSGLKSAPRKPQKPKALAVEPEAVLALEKLKKPAAVQHQSPAIPEAMLKLQSLKPKPSHLRVQETKAPKKNLQEPELKKEPKKLELRKLEPMKEPKKPGLRKLEPKKEPTIPTPEIEKSEPTKLDFHSQLSSVLRAQTEPSLTKAPMEIRRSNTTPEASGKLTHPTKSRAKGPKRKLPKKTAEAPKAAPISVPKKVPPPKAKKPDFKLESRFNSEVFI